MLCVRCSHPLPTGADRCLRCFALNPQNRTAGPQKSVPTPEPPSFLQGPESDPELQPLDVPLESDPPPARVALDLRSDPPAPVRASIEDQPPATHQFDLAPPATSPSMKRASAPPGAPSPSSAPTEPPPAPRPATARRSEGERRATPTLVFAARPPQREIDLGDIELGNLEAGAPTPLLADDEEQTLQFSLPASAARPGPRPPEPRKPVPLEPEWRAKSQPPDPLSRELDLSSALAPALGVPVDLSPAPALAPLPLDLTPAPGVAPLVVDLSPPPPQAPSERPSAPDAAARRPEPWAPAGRRVLAWLVDAALLAACAAANALLAARIVGAERLAPSGFGSVDYWLDLLGNARLLPLWLGLFACLALAYSWLFAAVGGRTPGLMLLGLRLVPISGERVKPLRALARAALSLLAAAPALFGFALALFDPRGQALHDKLTDTVVVRDGSLAPGRALP